MFNTTTRTLCTKFLQALLIALLSIFVFTGSFAVAQNVANATSTGVITGTLNGEEFAWRTVLLATPNGEQNTASYNRMSIGPLTLFDFSLQGHFEDKFSEQAIVLEFAVFDEADLLGCPCTFDNGRATYFTTSSMFAELYVAEGTLTLETVEKLDDDTYAMSGTFVGEGVFMESPGNVIEENIMEFNINFTIERVSAFDIDL